MYSFWSYLPSFIKHNNPIRYLLNRYYGKVFLSKESVKVELANNKNEEIEIYIVAFNNDKLIENQVYFLKKNCLDNYKLIIADNSSNKEISDKIYNLCKKEHLDYIKLPKNKKLELSWSHGYTLNYLMKHFILKSKIPYFGLLDHDCFLIKKMSFIKELGHIGIWGSFPQDHSIKIGKKIINGAGNRRFLWPGCCFFNKTLFNNGYDFTPSKRLFPLSFLDTGGGNRKYIYKNLDKNSLNILNMDGDGEFEYLGDRFFHISGAGWRRKEKVEESLKKLKLDYD